MTKNKTNKKRWELGITIIESIIGVVVLLIISITIFSLFTIIFGTIRNSKARITANSIALEQLEIIRGMEFSNIATDTGWIPPGNIPTERMINRAGFNFSVKTDITFVDDEYDGIGDEDSFPFDYKKARIRVSWKNPVTRIDEEVAMSTSISQNGLEGLSPNKGGILITVFDASGEVVSSANAHIESNSLSYSIDALTDLNGNLWVANLEPSDDYHIIVSKDGYNSDQTYPVNNDPGSPDYNPIPSKPDAVVTANEVTRIGFSIDILGNLNIQTVNYGNPQNWKINTDTGENNQVEVAAAIDELDNIFFVWSDDRNGAERFYAQKYSYNTSTGLYENQWDEDIQITTVNNKENPRIAVFSSNFFYVVGTDARNGNQDVFLEKYSSSDGSSVWNDVKVNIDANSADQIKADLAIDTVGNIYATWMDGRSGNWDIYAQKVSSDGNIIWAEDLKINNDSTSYDQKNPKIITDDEDNFYIVWEDEINGDKDIFLAGFFDNGNVIFNGKKINTDDSGLDQYEPSISFDGSDYLYISWTDKRNSQPDIYAQKYDKLGNIALSGNWANGDVEINDDSTPDAWRTKSDVSFFDNSAIYFSWEDTRNGGNDIYSIKFNSNGERLWEYDLIMNSVSEEEQNAPIVIVDSDGYGITTWEDSRNGNFDIFAARYNNIGSFTRSNVQIIVKGAKLKGTYPNETPPPDYLPIYKYSKTFTSNSSGNINIGDGINEIEWDNYSFTAVDPYTIISTDTPEPLVINPGETKSIVINIEP